MNLNIPNITLIVLSSLSWIGCGPPDPNTNINGKDELKSHEIDVSVSDTTMAFHDVIYIPIYSDIYIDAQNQNNLLAATLSIRNNSLTDSTFISNISYYNSEGIIVRKFIDNTIGIQSMETVNYVIERDDTSGGSGANFLVELYAKHKNFKPLIQAVMIGQNGNKGSSFSTNGYSIK
jgi:hypothetical protein